MSRERLLVTSALPYANGPLHVGHAIGAYIPADVYVRYHRLKGNDVVFICGSDEHGTPITVTAEKEGIPPQAVVDKYHKAIKEAFKDLGISFDNYSRTTEGIHYKNSQEFFKKVMENGFVYKKTVERPYCPQCRRFLPDRFVKGICPYCNSEDQRGDQCEACGKQLEPHELKNAYCIICNGTPEQRETEHWFFKLSEFSHKLREWILCNKHWPDNARNFSLGWISEGLEDRAITRDLSWGVPVPLKGAEDKVLYVWFEAPIGYISSTQEWAEKKGNPGEWRKYWIEDCKIIHFIGKDNIPFHAIIWPAMLMAHSGFNLPWQVSSNEYLTLEGRKMSTSRGWVLWLHDILNEFDADLIRYYLLSINPAKHDSDFSLKEFQHKVNNELVAAFGNFINRSLTFIEKQGSMIPKVEDFDELDEQLLERIREAPEHVGRHIEEFRFLEALKELMSLAHFGNEYFQGKEPWRNENSTTLYLCANLTRTLAILSAPFLPHSAERIWGMLGLEGSVFDESWSRAAELDIRERHRIGRITLLYDKIDDKRIEGFDRRYLRKEKVVEKMDYVEFQDFEKLGLRVAEIKEVRDHPRADKLYLLQVDLGDEVRQLIAGIKESYSKEDLIGKQIIVATNLKPREIRGETSYGMLLAVDVEGKPVLLMPEKRVTSGSMIR
ncbi:MAG: methionine--tRNA ligase [Candidatus Altiarchaeota archaeon]|nr:methionine--tRNA ligase [Candidatus Altiarchaeota archaeon]